MPLAALKTRRACAYKPKMATLEETYSNLGGAVLATAVIRNYNYEVGSGPHRHAYVEIVIEEEQKPAWEGRLALMPSNLCH